MSGSAPKISKNQHRGHPAWAVDNRATRKQKPLVTQELREALDELMRTEPERFIAACCAVRVSSLMEVPAYECLILQNKPEDRMLRLYLKGLAEGSGIKAADDLKASDAMKAAA